METGSFLDFSPTPSRTTGYSEDSKTALVPLPDNWAQLDNFIRPKSCVCTTVVHTCVNKAQSHLELLQNAIEDWLYEKAKCPPSVQQHGISNKSSAKPILPNPEMLLHETSLQVMGTGWQIGGGSAAESCRSSEIPEIPSLGADEVISEAIAILARLERDRAFIETRIEQERVRVIQMADKVEKMAFLRLTEMAKAVQLEHEACAENTAELLWHIEQKKKEKKNAKKRKNKALDINERLKAHVDHMLIQKPLLQEKIDLEVTSVNNIKKAREQTENHMAEVERRREAVQARHDLAFSEAAKERKQMAKEIRTAKNLLEQATSNLKQASKDYNQMLEDIETSKVTIAENKVLIEKLKVEKAEKEEIEKVAKKRLELVKSRLAEILTKQQEIQSENQALNEFYLAQKLAQESETKEMQAAIEKKEDKLTAVSRVNKEMELDIQSMSEKKNKCIRQKEKDERSIVRMNEELEEINNQMGTMDDEVAKVTAKHAEVTERLRRMERQTRQKEDQLRGQLNALQKNVEQEAETRTVLAARIQADSKDLTAFKEEARIKRAKMQTLQMEVDKAVAKIREKVAKLVVEAKTWTETRERVQAAYDKVLAEHQNIKSDLTGQLDTLRPQHAAATEALAKLVHRLEYIAHNSDLMNNKLDEILGSASMITKTKAKFDDMIAKLTDELADLNIEVQRGVRFETGIRQKIQNTTSRVNENEVQHKKFLMNRSDVQKQLNTDIEQSFALNTDLAAKYRAIQSDYYHLKEGYLDMNSEKIQFETTVKDVKQVRKLQSQLHHALYVYLRTWEAFNHARFEALQTRSDEANARVNALHFEINRSTDHVKSFLDAEMETLMTGKRLAIPKSGQRIVPEILMAQESMTKPTQEEITASY